MCGRYQFTWEDDPELLRILGAVQEEEPDWRPGEIFPQTKAPVLVAQGEAIRPLLQTWGFPGIRGKGVIINARAETAQEKPMFQESLLERRCVIPTTGFFEWSKEKEKTLFHLPGERLLCLAGFYKIFDGMARYCILTTAANSSVSPIHARMPIILPGEDRAKWLGDTTKALDLLQTVPPPLERQAAGGQLKLW